MRRKPEIGFTGDVNLLIKGRANRVDNEVVVTSV